MKIFLKGIATLLTLGSLADARTWTNSDGTLEFEGEIQSYNPKSQEVTILVEDQTVVFSQDKLSAKDQEFLKNWTPPTPEPEQPQAEEDLIPRLLKNDVLSVLKENSFQAAQLEKSPQYYLLYFSASW